MKNTNKPYVEWTDIKHELYSTEDILESSIRVSIINELIKARNEKNITQKQLEELSGIKQPMIARIEKGDTNIRIETLLRILAPLGKTIAIVPIEKISR